eukprot:926757_1
MADFFKYFNEKEWTVTNNGKTLTRKSGGMFNKKGESFKTVYGSKVISYDSNSIYKWCIKMNKANVPIYIGIDEANHKHIDTRFHEGRGSIHYCYSSRGGKFNANGDYSENYLSSCRAGAIVNMELNLITKTIGFSINKNKIEKAFDVEKTENGYRLAVCCFNGGYSVTLLSFEEVNISKENENKNDIEMKLDEKKNEPKRYNEEIVNQLVNMGIGTRDECIAASQMTNNYNDVNAVMSAVKEKQNKQQYNTIRSEMDAYDAVSNPIDLLNNIIKNRFNYMAAQDKNVGLIILAAGEQKSKLENAKAKSIETEKKLMKDIMNITAMNSFLNNIILIENLFNCQYNESSKSKQKTARNKYAKNISIYENKPKPICDVPSFVDLLFQAYTDLGAFKDWLKLLQSECEKQNVKLSTKPEAKQKNIERAFYKTFYVYAFKFSDGARAHQRLTDVLRCSLVFDTFDDLYHCFAIIESLTQSNGGIVRCKDRFNPHNIPFGYRDLLVNIMCPKSKIVCEVQLHHELFYKHKKISHYMYKRARLFEDRDGNNQAYKYANEYIRSSVGNKQYQYDDDSKENELDPIQLLKEWNLSRYAKQLIDEEGYDDPSLWIDIGEEELKAMGFKTGHAKKFVNKVSQLKI